MGDKKQMAIDLITRLEGVELKAYPDVAGYWTIGVGTIKKPDGTRIKEGDTCTLDEAKLWLKDHLDRYVFPVLSVVEKMIGYKLSDEVYAALASLGYNIGSALTGKSIINALKLRELDALEDAFKRYVNADGKFVQGLLNRRLKEIDLFKKKVKNA